MGKKIIRTIIFLGAFFGFFLKTGFVLALEVNYPPLFGYSVNNTSDLAEYACYLIGVALNLAIIVATIAIAYGGIYYLISYGRGKFTSEAKDIIKSAILGLLIIVCATLIAHTINPALTSCKVGVLSFLNASPSSGTANPYNAPIVTYKEIPLGTLTETLLTRTVGCYGFDEEGNPLDGEEIITDNKKKEIGPTYINHDRADCLLQLVEGADKKAQVVAALSAKITELMNECDCEKYGDCKPKCNPITGCQVTACPGGSCIGDCVGGACLSTPSIPDCCPTGVKDKIENGPVAVEVDVGSSTTGRDCKTQEKTFKGLDEFRCPAPGAKITQCAGIADLVEKEVVVKGEKIRLVIQKEWEKLNLTQQLIYFKEKIDDLKKKIQADQGLLTKARDTLQDPRCYLSTTYVGLLQTYKTTEQRDKFVKIEKVFPDPETGEQVSVARYCTGFNYNNSSCFKKCNNECPDTSLEVRKLYVELKDCVRTDKDYESCVATQNQRLLGYYKQRPCTLGDNSSQVYSECIASCQGECSNNCAKKYLLCSNDYKICKEQCSNNSECVLNNNDSCLFNPQKFKDCAVSVGDEGNIDYCINNAYLCKNGSNQYAGYADCISPPEVSSGECSSHGNSASFLFEHPECQKCPDPNKPPVEGACAPAITDTTNKTNDDTPSCQDLCPETSKCPTASFCPDCPCDKIDQTFNFSVPIESKKNIELSIWANRGQSNITSSREIKAYQMVGPECNEYSYNDDPLTFYCQYNWWNDPGREGRTPKATGAQRTCLPGGEVPVGQTVDSAQNWANNLINSADDMKQNIENMLVQMYKAGKAKDTSPIQNYCKCDAKFENSLPICITDCDYSEKWIEESFDGDGNIIPGHWDCNCIQTPCEGKPCEQITDYLSQLWNAYRDFKIGFIDLYENIIAEPRSDIMKKLTYSRKQANQCSLERNNYGVESRLFNCERVEDEIMPPINGNKTIINGKKIEDYCYGKNLGTLFNQTLTDNWFCCRDQQRTQGETSGASLGPNSWAPSADCLYKNDGNVDACK